MAKQIRLVIIGIKQQIDEENKQLAELPHDPNYYVGSLKGQRTLKDLEDIVIKGIIGAYAMGDTLKKIRDKKLYKYRFYAEKNRPFNTFEEYIKTIFTISKMHAYRLIAYHYVRNLIGETANTKIPERLVRPLTSIKDGDTVKKLWKQAKKQSHGDLPTSDTLSVIVHEYKASERNAKTEKKKAKCTEDDFFSELLQKKISTDDPLAFMVAEAEKAKKKIERLQALYVDFQTHYEFSAEAQKQLIQTVEKWQKADLDEFTNAILGK